MDPDDEEAARMLRHKNHKSKPEPIHFGFANFENEDEDREGAEATDAAPDNDGGGDDT